MSRSADPGEGLFSPEELALLARFQRSKAWRLLRDAMARDREDLLGSQPTSDAQLWQTWGEITRLSRYLREGPQFVVFYQRFMDEQARIRAGAGTGDEPRADEPVNFDVDL